MTRFSDSQQNRTPCIMELINTAKRAGRSDARTTLCLIRSLEKHFPCNVCQSECFFSPSGLFLVVLCKGKTGEANKISLVCHDTYNWPDMHCWIMRLKLDTFSRHQVIHQTTDWHFKLTDSAVKARAVTQSLDFYNMFEDLLGYLIVKKRE